MAKGQYEGDSIAGLRGELDRLSSEYEALLQSARAILTHRDFETSAREIFGLCREITGATSGYVALLSADGTENEVLFLDPGGMLCGVDENLPMPIRGLREKAYRSRSGVYDNHFANSKWTNLLPEGHMPLENVLFAPLVIEGQAVGLIGLANKDGGFDDRDLRFVSSLGDVAAAALRNSRNLEEIRYLSFHDQLTDLYNRRYLHRELTRLEDSDEYPIAIILADLDGLKGINDRYGHAEGDRYLRSFADVLREIFRDDDIVARMGGDEFVVVLPDTDRDEGERIVSRIRSAVESFNRNTPNPPLSISLGLAVSEDRAQPFERTYHLADRRMYREKRGR